MELIQIVNNVNKRYEGDLTHYFKLVMKSPNAYKPYHNVRHMLHVMWEAYDGGIQMGLDPIELRCLLIGAMMHDYNHTGIKINDQVNIDRAVEGLKKNILAQDEIYFDKIKRYIEVTQYPYVSDNFSQNELILRDADQSQTFSSVWVQSVLYGLGTELEMSYEQMLKLQIPFLKNLKFYTVWGKNKFEALIKPRLDLVNNMLKLLK